LKVVLALALVLASVPARGAPRVIIVSFDGAGFVTTSRLISEAKLPHFERLVREGAWSDGMVSSFPTKTAAAHAMLFTGQYGHTNGITGNEVLRVPPERGSRVETMNGYFSDSLRSEPVWEMAANAGFDAYVFHAPQAYPFHAVPRLFAAHGYTDARVKGEVLDPDAALAPAPDEAWLVPDAWRKEAREIRFTVGETAFKGVLFDDPLDPKAGIDTLGVAPASDLSSFVARVKAGAEGGFSEPVAAWISGKKAWFSVRLFDCARDGSSFVLYRSGAAEMALSTMEFPGAATVGLEAYAGNGGTDAYETGRLGPTLAQGGDGEAERRLLETLEHLLTQLVAQARLALSRDYRLLVLYSPVTDDVAHQIHGHLAPELPGHDPSLAGQLWPVMAGAFALQDRFLSVILEAAERDAAHVVVVSDHGMSGTNKLVHLNLALQQAGLLAVDEAGEIDLARTRALAPPLGDLSVAVNAVDRPGGIVPLPERESVLASVRQALEALHDPDSGERIVTAFFDPATAGLLQPGGASTGDLFLDLAPGYYPSTDAKGALVETTVPEGNHVFVPTRRDMLAIFALWGPSVPHGVRLGRVRAIDVTPTILELLSIPARPDLPGRSLVPGRGILN
jgi:predicted AlkP superfamily phosphohydrolase/phosphomutase